MPTIFSRN